MKRVGPKPGHEDAPCYERGFGPVLGWGRAKECRPDSKPEHWEMKGWWRKGWRWKESEKCQPKIFVRSSWAWCSQDDARPGVADNTAEGKKTWRGRMEKKLQRDRVEKKAEGRVEVECGRGMRCWERGKGQTEMEINLQTMQNFPDDPLQFPSNMQQLPLSVLLQMCSMQTHVAHTCRWWQCKSAIVLLWHHSRAAIINQR